MRGRGAAARCLGVEKGAAVDEDREEWREMVTDHCRQIFFDPEETREVQEAAVEAL